MPEPAREPLRRSEIVHAQREPVEERVPRRVTAGAVALVAVLLALAAILYLRSRPAPVVISPRVPVPSLSPALTPTASPSLLVHVAGAVARPGVVSMPGGSRVVDALAAAGGPVADAATDTVNLARRLADGERIYVPRRGEAVPPEAATDATSAGPLDLNAATRDALDSLPGVGPVLAQRILEHRAAHGPFHDVRQLLDIPGIGEKLFTELRQRVTVG